jgi:hypothetical protein
MLFGSFDAAVSRQDDSLVVDQDRDRKAERLYALGQLMQLPGRMGSSILWVRFQISDVTLFDLEIAELRHPRVSLCHIRRFQSDV